MCTDRGVRCFEEEVRLKRCAADAKRRHSGRLAIQKGKRFTNALLWSRVSRLPMFVGLPEHPPLRGETEENLAHGLEMDWPALALLGPGVDVAQPPLERVFVENRGRAGRTIDRGDDVPRLVDCPGRGEAQPDVLLVQELALALGLLPHLGEGLVDEGARTT